MIENILAIIPARSGSKGIPGKNLMRVAGRSILEWTVNAAIEAVGEESVVVSSDGDAILAHARELGVRTHKRSDTASSDTASSEIAILEALLSMQAEGIQRDRLLFMQCTSPCILAEDLYALVNEYDAKQLDSAFTAVESHAFLWKQGADGTAMAVNHDQEFRPRRQEREPEFRENGAAYLVSSKGFAESKHRFFGKCGFSLMPAERSWEIDTYCDAVVVEALLAKRLFEPSLDTSWCRAIVFDFDGVLTDNAVYLTEDGVESVRCHRGDGFGFGLASKANLNTLILSKERNKVVSSRAAKLKCEVVQGVDDKPTVLSNWLTDNQLSWKDIVYVGNDLNDLECIRKARLGVAVADAVKEVKAEANLTLKNLGGHGAAREIIELVLKTK